MLDIKFIRENPDKVKAGIANKNEKGNVDGVLALDEERRNIIVQVEELKATRNKVSSQIPKMKKAGEDTTEVLAEMKQVSDNVAEMDSKLKHIYDKLNGLLMFIPNLPHESVPAGKTEKDNKIIREWLPGGFSFKS